MAPGKSGLPGVVRVSASLVSSHGRGIKPQNTLKKDSRGLSWFAAVWGAARENRVLCPKNTALRAASFLEGLLSDIALCPATPEIRRLFTASTWSSVQISHAQRNVIWYKK